jgi:hypothetical protein
MFGWFKLDPRAVSITAICSRLLLRLSAANRSRAAPKPSNLTLTPAAAAADGPAGLPVLCIAESKVVSPPGSCTTFTAAAMPRHVARYTTPKVPLPMTSCSCKCCCCCCCCCWVREGVVVERLVLESELRMPRLRIERVPGASAGYKHHHQQQQQQQ